MKLPTWLRMRNPEAQTDCPFCGIDAVGLIESHPYVCESNPDRLEGGTNENEVPKR